MITFARRLNKIPEVVFLLTNCFVVVVVVNFANHNRLFREVTIKVGQVTNIPTILNLLNLKKNESTDQTGKTIRSKT